MRAGRVFAGDLAVEVGAEDVVAAGEAIEEKLTRPRRQRVRDDLRFYDDERPDAREELIANLVAPRAGRRHPVARAAVPVSVGENAALFGS